MEFDEGVYREKLDKFYRDVNLVFDGNGSKKTADILMEYLGD